MALLLRCPLAIKHGNGKSPINGNGGFKRKSLINGPFSIAMFDDTGGYDSYVAEVTDMMIPGC